jgi:hypothetical protein
MSRLPMSRVNKVLVWTTAATAWGTAFVTTMLEPARSEAVAAANPIEEASVLQPAIPAAPPAGLVILRYTPVTAPAPEIRTIYVSQPRQASTKSSSSAKSSTSSGGSTAAAPPPAAPASAPAPAPKSSGS